MIRCVCVQHLYYNTETRPSSSLRRRRYNIIYYKSGNNKVGGGKKDWRKISRVSVKIIKKKKEKEKEIFFYRPRGKSRVVNVSLGRIYPLFYVFLLTFLYRVVVVACICTRGNKVVDIAAHNGVLLPFTTICLYIYTHTHLKNTC